MYVTIMQVLLTIVLFPFGITPEWCDCCGEMYQLEQMEYCFYVDHNEEEHEGYLCPFCVDYWNC